MDRIGAGIAVAWLGCVLALAAPPARAENVFADGMLPLDVAQQKAAAGERTAEAQLGSRYLMGRGVPQDPGKAVEWLTRAADAGSAYAAAALSKAYFQGRTLPKDDDAARKWLQRQAELGDWDGEVKWGETLRDGAGVPKDEAAAARWFERAADRGWGPAQVAFGRALKDGIGRPRDPDAAYVWFRRAADQGEIGGMKELGFASAEGNGTPPNLGVAYCWFTAAQDALPEPRRPEFDYLLLQIEPHLSKRAIAAARAAGHAWKPGDSCGAGAAPAKAGAGPGGGPHAGGGTGTGFVVGRGGEVLTNAHVAADCTELTLHLPGSTPVKARLLAADRELDLAVLSAPLGLQPLVFRQGLPRPGDAVLAFGFALGPILASEGNVTLGNVTALSGIRDNRRMLQVSAPVQPGNSGGPLVDLGGNVLGIVTSGLKSFKVSRGQTVTPQNVNFAIKAEVAEAFLDKNAVPYDTRAIAADMKPADVAELIKRSAVAIECRR